MKIIFSLVLVLISILFTTCIFIEVDNDFEIHTAYFNNASSYNIYIQHYSLDHNNVETNYFFAYGVNIPKYSTAEYVAPLNDIYLEKILIVDIETRKLLRKISGTTYYSMLTPPNIIVGGNSNGGKTTYYYYYFVITDEFLYGN